MIVSFSVANFRSFLDEETFSLVAAKGFSDTHPTHVVPIPDSGEQVLKTSVVYGANGAGKSNLFKALRYLKNLALQPRAKNSGTGREVFRFAEQAAEQPSSFDLQFIAQGRLYRFGCVVSDQRIEEEWLVQVVDGEEEVIYERATDEIDQMTIELKDTQSVSKKLTALATVGGLQNQSFLATIQANLEESDYGVHIIAVVRWFEDTLNLIAPDDYVKLLGYILDDNLEFREFAGAFLSSAATGVDAVQVKKQHITETDLHTFLPESFISRLLAEATEDANGMTVIRAPDQKEIFIKNLDDKTEFYTLNIQARHESQPNTYVTLDLSQESDGTQRLLNLIPALYKSRSKYVVYFIDEIERSMHPILVWNFLDFFLKSCTDGYSQIIATTHESHLLDYKLLRRDEIWFTEKDQTGATHLYSLADFKPRNDEIRKHYLQGRFGAIPVLGGLKQLMEENQ